MNTEVNYRGSGIIVSETSSGTTDYKVTQVRPQGINSGWMYLHMSDTTWMTYHIQKVQRIDVDESRGPLSDTSTLKLDVHTGYGEHLTIFMNDATALMMADAVNRCIERLNASHATASGK